MYCIILPYDSQIIGYFRSSVSFIKSVSNSQTALTPTTDIIYITIVLLSEDKVWHFVKGEKGVGVWLLVQIVLKIEAWRQDYPVDCHLTVTSGQSHSRNQHLLSRCSRHTSPQHWRAKPCELTRRLNPALARSSQCQYGYVMTSRSWDGTVHSRHTVSDRLISRSCMRSTAHQVQITMHHTALVGFSSCPANCKQKCENVHFLQPTQGWKVMVPEPSLTLSHGIGLRWVVSLTTRSLQPRSTLNWRSTSGLESAIDPRLSSSLPSHYTDEVVIQRHRNDHKKKQQVNEHLSDVKWFDTDVSELPIGPIFKGQDVHFFFDSLVHEYGTNRVPKRRYQTTLRRVRTQKAE